MASNKKNNKKSGEKRGISGIGVRAAAIKKDKSNVKKVGFFKRIVNFVKELKSELKKVVWPSRKNVVMSTFVVVLAIVIMSVFVMFADYIFRNLLEVMFKTL